MGKYDLLLSSVDDEEEESAAQPVATDYSALMNAVDDDAEAEEKPYEYKHIKTGDPLSAVTGQISSAIHGFGRGLSFGGIGKAMEKVAPEEAERTEELRRAYPAGSAVGEMASYVATGVPKAIGKGLTRATAKATAKALPLIKSTKLGGKIARGLFRALMQGAEGAATGAIVEGTKAAVGRPGEEFDLKRGVEFAKQDAKYGMAFGTGLGIVGEGVRALSPAAKASAKKIIHTYLRPGRKGEIEGFDAENLFKHNLARENIDDMAQATRSKLDELLGKQKEIRQLGKEQDFGINVVEGIERAKEEAFRSGKVNFHDKRKATALFNELIEEAWSSSNSGVFDLDDAMSYITDTGAKAHWIKGAIQRGATDVTSQDEVYMTVYRNLRKMANEEIEAMQKAMPWKAIDIKTINKEFSEVLPVSNAIARRAGTIKGNMGISPLELLLTGIGTTGGIGAAAISDEGEGRVGRIAKGALIGLGGAAVARGLRSPTVAKGLYRFGQKTGRVPPSTVGRIFQGKEKTTAPMKLRDALDTPGSRAMGGGAVGAGIGAASAEEGERRKGALIGFGIGAGAGVAMSPGVRRMIARQAGNERGAISWAKVENYENKIGKLPLRSKQIIGDLADISEIDKEISSAVLKTHKETGAPVRKSVHVLNGELKKNPKARQRLLEIQKASPVDFVDENGYLKPIAIETVKKPNKGKILEEARAVNDQKPRDVIVGQLESFGLPTNGKTDDLAERLAAAKGEMEWKYGGFKRSIGQMYWDGLEPDAAEALRSQMVKSTEEAFSSAKKGPPQKGSPLSMIMGEDGLGKKISDIEKESGDFRIQDPFRQAHKTVVALNLNSACPTFTIGNNGCWGDACYLTGTGSGGTTINLFQRAAYTGEFLQITDNEVRMINKLGGARINGVGDAIPGVKSQWKDAIKHAGMRKMDVKVISKQEETFKILNELANEGVDISRVQAQPSIDYWWTPVSEDAKEVGSAAKQWGIDVLSREKKDDAVKAAYDYFGRESKNIKGEMHRKYGFTIGQFQKLKEKYPNVNINPRIIVASPEEIVQAAKDFPLDANGNATAIITFMHGIPRGNITSEVGGNLLNFGDARHVFEEAGGSWSVKGAFHGKKGKGITIKTTKSHTALEDYIKKSVPEEQQDNIFRTLKKSTCCQNSDQIDACAGCATNCALYHKNGADAGIEILKTKKAVAKKPKAKKPTQSFKPTVKRTEKPLPGLATFKLRR